MAVVRRPLTDAPDRLEADARERIRAWAAAHVPSVALHLGRHWAECRDYHLSRGILRADWAAAFRNWLRKAVEFEGRRPDPAIRRSPVLRDPYGPVPYLETTTSWSPWPPPTPQEPTPLKDGLADVIPLYRKDRPA